MKKVSTIFSILLSCLLINFNCLAQLEVAANSSAEELIQTLLGDGVEVLSVSLNCPEGASGTFDAEFTNLSLGDGVLLTSGSIDNAIGPNSTSGASTSIGSAGDEDLDDLIPGFETNDACVLEISFIPYGDTLSFNYVFGSEEYAGFVCSNFNDVFGFFISGGPEYAEPTNIALIPNSDLPVSINSVNIGVPDGSAEPCYLDNTEYYVDNGTGAVTLPNSTIQYDGFTTVIPAVAAVTACEEYTIKLAVADAGDTSLDSGVFIEAGSFSVNSFFLEATTSLTTIEGFDYTIEECVDGIITFSRNYVNDAPSIINFELGGTAENGVDYEFIESFITIPAGEQSVDLIIETIDDALDEADEFLTISIANELGCDTVLVQDVELLIVDPTEMTVSENVEILFGASTQLFVEGGGASYFWSPAESLDNFNIANPVASPSETTTYTVTSVLGDCFYTEQVIVTVLPFDCDSDAGSFVNTERIIACEGSTFSISATDYITATVDTFDSAIMIHTIGDESIGEVLAIINEPAATFDLSTIDGLAYNTIYYVSRVIDLQDDGMVNPMGVCVDVAIGPELVVLAPIAIEEDFECDNDIGIFTITYSITGGLPAFDGSDYLLSGDASAAIEVGQLITLQYFNNSGVSLTASDDNGCTGNFTGGPYECIKSTAVELVTFRGVSQESGNLLVWQTASEFDTEVFNLEKSKNGFDFKAFVTIEPKGNESTGATYEFFDETMDAKTFYRLAEIDITGKITYSDIIILERITTINLDIYPNPVEDELTVEFSLSHNEPVDISIFDLSGKKLLTSLVAGVEGVNYFQITTNNLPTGMFLIEVKSSEGIISKKLIKE